MDTTIVRRLWATLEPIHATIYFVPEVFEAWQKVGFTHPRMGYFAQRSAAMGAVEAPVVSATFYNFNPATVERFIPDAWEIAAPEEVVRLRYAAADRALRRLLGEAVASPEMEWAANTAMAAAAACPPDGRALFAAHAAVPVPEEPHLRLWHATTLLREFRGDGHVIALVSASLSGLEAVVSYAATGDLFDEDFYRRSRGWSEEDWDTGRASLRARQWLDADGTLTQAGVAGRQAVEDETDRLAMAPWAELDQDTVVRLADTVRPWARAIIDADVIGGGGRNVRVFAESV